MVCYSLFSGSSGNCIYLEKLNTRILVDAGCSLKKITSNLTAIGTELSSIQAILLTHEHLDHIKALPMLLKHFSIPIYCQNEVAKKIYFDMLSSNLDTAKSFARMVRTIVPGEEYEIGDFSVSPFQTPHDSADSEGFVFDDRALGIATDLGHISPEVRKYLSGCRSVILESNHDLRMLYDGGYPPYLKERVAGDRGHLNNEACAHFSAELVQHGCEHLTLFHLSRDNNSPDLAMQEQKTALDGIGARIGSDLTLQTADRHEVTKVL